MVISQILDQIYKTAANCLDECNKYILMPEQFDQQAEQFCYIIGQAASVLSSPPIIVVDVDNEAHYCSSTEKWKLFAPFIVNDSSAEDELVSLAVSNPNTNTLDRFKTTKKLIQYALICYENTYNTNIEKLVSINELFIKTRSMVSRTDRLQEYRKLLDSLVESKDKDICLDTKESSTELEN